ncbi:PREDICTED: 40S ribosomal protein S27-2-like [Fragaria vesca subsp. vesca]
MVAAPVPVPVTVLEGFPVPLYGQDSLAEDQRSSLLNQSACLELEVLQNDIDLLHPPVDLEKRKHKLKRLLLTPNSFFMFYSCTGCFNITTVFSHSQTVVCGNCQTVLCQPTGGRARLTEGCSFRKKGD